MNADLEHLIVLQAQDIELARLRSDLTELPRRIKTAEETLRQADSTLASTRDAIAAEEKLRRNQESEINSHRAKVARLRRSLEGATNTAQVAAFEREIEFATAAIGALEDQELASMERSEQLDVELSRAETEAAQQKTVLATERDRAASNTTEWQAQIAGLDQQRKALRSEVQEGPLATYDRLRKNKGTAVAEALGNATQGKCAACQMAVRPQRWQDLIGRDHDDEIFLCESCGRMLFWDLRRDTPKAWEAGDRLRRAQTGSGR